MRTLFESRPITGRGETPTIAQALRQSDAFTGRLVETRVFVPPLGQLKGLLPLGRRVSCGSRTVVVGTLAENTGAASRKLANSLDKHIVCGRRKCR